MVGAGVIGCEYTTIFGALGIKVSLIDGRDRLLGFLDGEMADQPRLQMGFLGVDLRLKETVTRYVPEAEGVRLELQSGGSLTVDQVLVAAGRVANVAKLSIERAGSPSTSAACSRSTIAIRPRCPTSTPPAMSSASRRWPRSRWSRRASPWCLSAGSLHDPRDRHDGRDGRELPAEQDRLRRGPRVLAHERPRPDRGRLSGEVKPVFRYPDELLLGVHVIGEIAAELVHIGLIALRTECTIVGEHRLQLPLAR